MYQGILDAWDDPEKVAAALHEACDYHCTQMTDSLGEWKAEFDYPPFDLIPVEISFVIAIRKRLGLPTAPVDHPILIPLPKHLDATPDPEICELIGQVEEKYRKVFSSE